MKNLFLFMAITLVGLGGCSEKRSQPLAIDNSLTQEEIAGRRSLARSDVENGPRRTGLALARRQSAALHRHLVQYAGEPGRYGDLRS